MTPAAVQGSVRRRRWSISGQVQGVGFRPFVFRLAQRLELSGHVRNDADGLSIEAQGPTPALDAFDEALRRQRPLLAVVDACERLDLEPDPHLTGFQIIASAPADPDRCVNTGVTVDTALCDDCLREITDPSDRRYRHALNNCTNCGPRFSIIRCAPYDRPNTTMASFPMCGDCRREYTDPADRRHHAQPIACPRCGPRLELVSPAGAPLPGDPLAAAAAMLAQGQIIAVKGLGGFHLAVRADDAQAVRNLRRAKARDSKPFALMVRSLDTARRLVHLSAAAEELMRSPRCPIVLAPRRAGSRIAHDVAPGHHRLGVMLAHTPVQHLLWDELPPEINALVMTSGNRNDEPIAIDNDEALQRLGTMCDALLWHDRPIQRCVDDSVLLDLGDGSAPLPVRRSRGHAPQALDLPITCDEPGLCVGGELKNTVAVVRGRSVILSQHLGDLKHALALEHFRRAIHDLCDLFHVRPRWIAHDLHPMYLSTAHARELAQRWQVRLIPVQHHHAHAAAVLAEHGRTEPVLAVVCDGTGYGTDTTSWGGELLRADLASFTRLAHVQPLRLPGGDAAARDPRRCALALMHQALGEDFASHPAARRLFPDDSERAMLTVMLRRNVSCAVSTGLGRVFDGIAALLGLCTRNDYEAHAAMTLESAAWGVTGDEHADPLYRLRPGEPAVLDLSPLVAALLDDPKPDARRWAWVFHEQLARAWDEVVRRFAERTGLDTVALTGGVFCNERLTRGLTDRLTRAGLRVLRHERAPANDGGLSLGQAAVAAALRAQGRERAGAACV